MTGSNDPDPETVSQLETGCVPESTGDIFPLSWQKAMELAKTKISDSLPVLEKLRLLSQTNWGRDRQKSGRMLIVIGGGLFVVGLAAYKMISRNPQQQNVDKDKAAGE